MSDEANRANEPAPVDRLSAIWRRLNQHKLVQWTVAYLALAYGIQHAIILTSESFEWPNAVPRLSMLLFALGLPLVMTFAWYQGERASRRFSAGECTIISLLLLCASLLFYVFVRPESAPAPSRATQEATLTAARAAAASPKGAISVAVLPFLNLSSDKEQEFFSDGMTEEITTALAKVPDLRVVGRTSAFQFKGQNKDLTAIGQALHATHLIEGSVRKAGNKLRITAQLIKADDGTHIWAEDYDRELTDVFAIQEDIARAITSSLHMTLGLKPGENLVNNRNIDPDSYDQLLRARGLIVSRTAVGDQSRPELMESAALLRTVVKRNPNFAPAWAWLAAADYLVATTETQIDQSFDKAKAAAEALRQEGEAAGKRAIELDPDLPGAYSSLGLLVWSRGKLLEADALYQKMLALTPEGHSEELAAYGIRLAETGHTREALALLEKGHAVDPLDPSEITFAAVGRWVNGDHSGALALAKSASPDVRARIVAMVYGSEGKYPDAAKALDEIIREPDSAAAKAAAVFRALPSKIPADTLPALPRPWDFVYVYAGAPERALDALERQVAMGFIGGAILDEVWHPSFAAVRNTKKFNTLMRKAGMVDFWRAKGWPPQCHPTTADDFECS